MPGYELSRFVDLTETEKTELTCSICQDIFKNPIFTNCCLQTFCEDCIQEWLKNNSTCPYDRKDLDSSQLTRPPRVLLNMLGKLKIYCNNRSKGCEDIFILDKLENHLKCCSYETKLCKECGFPEVADHNCIQCLLEANHKLEDKLISSEIRIKALETENENFLKTIHDLSNTNQSNANFNIRVSENQMLIDARKYLDSVIINSRTTPTLMSDRIVTIAKDAIIRNRLLFDVCKAIRTNVESKLGGLWQCNAFYDDMGNYSCTFDDSLFVNINFGKLRIAIHKVYEEINLKKLAELILKGEIKEELVIFRTDMTENDVNIIKNLVFNGIKKHNNLKEFTSNIFTELPKRFGGVWHCIVYKRYLGNFCVLPKAEKFINFYISDLNFSVFQIPDN